ncbi:thioredoxin-dependent thiol peroxidase [Candidatus Woesearchaeota archaeon]|nr:thioredoxin-dependent thiol peroxidase [Candidatus Woesearchaeota archaeon]
MITLKEGDKAPDFELEDGEGKSTRLSGFKGKKVILYFYPKDDTPGCTKEACDFRDNLRKLKVMNVEVLGVSNDDSDSHKKFAEKYHLPFALLCDTDKAVSKVYGVYGEKEKFGKKYFGITRSTFVIDENGRLKKIFYKVNPEQHIEEVLHAVQK